MNNPPEIIECHDLRATRSGGNPGQAVGPGGEGGLKGEAWRVVVSTVLTSQARRRRTPKRNRRIPTIPAGRTDVVPVDVSAVDTGPAGASPEFLPQSPAPPSQVRPSAP